MGEIKNPGKVCCIPYPVFAWITLGLEVLLLVIAVVGLYWLPMMAYIAKVVLISVALCCCKKDPCPHMATAVLFWTFAGCEFIGIIWLIHTKEAYALVYCHREE